MKYLLAITLMCLSQMSSAGSVYKCQTASGMAYQSSPCAKGAKKVASACNQNKGYGFNQPSHVNFNGESCEDKRIAANKADDIAKAKREAARKAELALPEPTIGMTEKQVGTGKWGWPNKVNRTINASGKSEQWIYDGIGYLYFTNGILTSIQD